MPPPVEHLARAALRLRGFSSRRVSTSEGEIHLVERWGDGPARTVVLLHGFGSASVHLGPLLKRLKPRVRRLIAPDMPAHGFSDRPRSGMRPEHLLSALFEALDAVIDEPVVLFGNSMGGYAAVRYALSRPEKVQALVLASPAGARADAAVLDEIRERFSLHDHGRALDFIDRLLARPSPIRHLLAWGVRRKFNQPDMVSFLESLDPEEHSITTDEVRQIEAPVLLLWGEADDILPRSHFEFWRESPPPHAEVERPKGMGHSPFLDRPGAVTERVLSFLDGLD